MPDLPAIVPSRSNLSPDPLSGQRSTMCKDYR
jgi:hypothetical protein